MEKLNKPHIVVLGAGFAGVWAVKEFSSKPVNVTLIDKNNYHTFLPLLYQVGTAAIEPEEIAYPVRSIIRNYSNVKFVRAEVTGINFSSKYVICNQREIYFDYCIIAAGTTTDFYNIPGADTAAFTLKSLNDAIILRNHILSCYERASYSIDPDQIKRLLTFVIIGGGASGVELAGAFAELIKGPLKMDFPDIPKEKQSIILIEASNRLLSMMPEKLGKYTYRRLTKMGVEVKTGLQVKKTGNGFIQLSDGNKIFTETAVWTAGVRGMDTLNNWGLPVLKDNRVKVEPSLQIMGMSCIYAAGDLVFFKDNEKILPQTAPVAVQQGAAAAKNILLQIDNKSPIPFHYRNRGAMVTIGRNSAVANIFNRPFKGFIAWLIWLIVHILNLIGFRNKILVMINWAWDYFFFERAVRLILPDCCSSPSVSSCVHRCSDNGERVNKGNY